MSLALTSKGRQSLKMRNNPSFSEADYVVLETIDDAQRDDNGLVSDKSFRVRATETLDGSVVDMTTDKLIKTDYIIGYKEAGGGIGVV